MIVSELQSVNLCYQVRVYLHACRIAVHTGCTMCCSTRCRLTCMMLLVMAGVETNPGPRGQSFRLGVFNAGGATKKAAGIHDSIHENKLNALALCETVSETTHDAVKRG